MLKEYAISIVTVSILAVIFEIILPPKNYRKYISVIIGLVVMMVIISPLGNFFGSVNEFVMEIPEINAENSNENSNALVAEEFCRRLEKKIEETVLSELSTESECRIVLKLNEKSEIEEIAEVKINPMTEEIALLINEKFAIEREKIGGFDDGN